MRPFLRFVVLFHLFVLSACNSEIKETMDISESFLHQRPDSALLILKSIDPLSLHSRKDLARYSLLMSAALDKNYIDVASDSLSKTAVDYYSRFGDEKQKMLAYYYHGITLKNGKHYPGAMIAFEKAEKEALALGDDYQLGLINRNKASISSENNNNQEAIKYAERAISFFKQANAKPYQVFAEYSLAISYINNKKYEKADSLLTAIQEKSDNQSLLFQCKIRKASILIIKGKDINTAIDYYRETPRCYYDILDYSYLALAFEQLGLKDSSDLWMSKGYLKCQDWTDSATLDYMKSKIALRRRQFEDAYYLANNALNAQDSLTRILLQQSISGAQRDFFKADVARQQLELITAKKKKTLGGIISILILFSCLVTILGITKEKNRQLQEQISRFALEEKKYQRMSKENAHLVGSLLSARFAHLDKLSRDFFLVEDKQDKDVIFKQIKQSVASIRNNPEVFTALEDDLNQYCNGIIRKLRSQVPRIKGDNLRMITLFFAGFSYEAVQFIMNRVSINSLKMARTRFRKEIISAHPADETLFLEMLDMKKRPLDNTNEE